MNRISSIFLHIRMYDPHSTRVDDREERNDKNLAIFSQESHHGCGRSRLRESREVERDLFT